MELDKKLNHQGLTLESPTNQVEPLNLELLLGRVTSAYTTLNKSEGLPPAQVKALTLQLLAEVNALLCRIFCALLTTYTEDDSTRLRLLDGLLVYIRLTVTNTLKGQGGEGGYNV